MSAMNTITAQRRKLDQISAKVQALKSNLASNGRNMALLFEDPISEALKKVSFFFNMRKVTIFKGPLQTLKEQQHL